MSQSNLPKKEMDVPCMLLELFGGKARYKYSCSRSRNSGGGGDYDDIQLRMKGGRTTG